MHAQLDYEAIVIGSGFGGAVMAARLGRRWPGQVAVLEQGREYALGSFPRSPMAMSDNFWCPEHDQSRRPPHVPRRRSSDGHSGLGLYDIRRFRRMDTVSSVGLGGGSLLFANVILPPPASTFVDPWPATVTLQRLQPYYRIVQEVLGARPLPPASHGHRRFVQRQRAFARFAEQHGLRSHPANLSVFFGNAYSYEGAEQALDMGVQEFNRYGARQTSCTYCGECNIGCNVHAKNSTDLNYLFVARQRLGVRIHTLAQVEVIVPLDCSGHDDPTASGEFGYRVGYRQLEGGQSASLTARRVVVSAGTLGSNELLLRCRDVSAALPRLSRQLGARFSGNGDFLGFVLDGQRDIDSTYGPVITQYIDHYLYQPRSDTPAFLLQDASFPVAAAWAVTALQPVMHPLARSWRLLRLLSDAALARPYPGRASGRLGGLLQRWLEGDLSQCSAVLLFMGKDNASGQLGLNREGWLDLHWSQQAQLPLYHSMLDLGESFRRFMHARRLLPLPTWLRPRRRNISVHPLGGCSLAVDDSHGVVSAADADRGQVFGYKGLYIADGSLMPTALGANPAASIAAISEWIAHGITGITPDSQLCDAEKSTEKQLHLYIQ